MVAILGLCRRVLPAKLALRRRGVGAGGPVVGPWRVGATLPSASTASKALATGGELCLRGMKVAFLPPVQGMGWGG